MATVIPPVVISVLQGHSADTDLSMIFPLVGPSHGGANAVVLQLGPPWKKLRLPSQALYGGSTPFV